MPGDSISFLDVQNALTRISKGERATNASLPTVDLMRFWLWGGDANEVCDRVKCDFHLMHLTGMVCSRVFTEAYHNASDTLDVVPVIIDISDIQMLSRTCTIFLPHFYDVPTSGGSISSSQVTSLAVPEYLSNLHTPQNQHGSIIKVPCRVSLQQLRDLVHAVQTQWPVLQSAVENENCPIQKKMILQTVDRLVTQLFIWFGSFLFSNDIEPWQADDTDFVEYVAPTQAMALTNMGIKFYLNIFFVLFRVLFIQRHAVVVQKQGYSDNINSQTSDNTHDQEGGDTNGQSVENSHFQQIHDLNNENPKEIIQYPFEIETFHLEAGIDDFHMLGMYFDIPAGCLLEYKHSYSGYYNNVSQCVYRHFPSYKRRKPVSIEDVIHRNASGLSVLPALKQIYPEIGFAFEDHHFERDVGVIRTAVLLSHGQSRKTQPDTAKTHMKSLQSHPSQSTNPCGVQSIHPPKASMIRSEKLLARVAACKGATMDSGNSSTGGDEGAHILRTTDWFWFVIGGSIYLVCTLDGVVYSGDCRDLLTFYLSRL